MSIVSFQIQPKPFFLRISQTWSSIVSLDTYVPLVTQCFCFVDFPYCFQTILSVFFFLNHTTSLKTKYIYFTYITGYQKGYVWTHSKQTEIKCILSSPRWYTQLLRHLQPSWDRMWYAWLQQHRLNSFEQWWQYFSAMIQTDK